MIENLSLTLKWLDLFEDPIAVDNLWSALQRNNPRKSLDEIKVEYFKNLPRAEGLLGELHGLLSMMFCRLHDIFERNGIHAWLMGGSAIGAVRHHYIIPWDNDGDIGIFRQDLPRLKAILDEDPLLKLDISYIHNGIVYNIHTRSEHSPNIDLFVWDRFNGSLPSIIERKNEERTVLDSIMKEPKPLKKRVMDFWDSAYGLSDNDGTRAVWGCEIPNHEKYQSRMLPIRDLQMLREEEFCGMDWGIPRDFPKYIEQEQGNGGNIWDFPKKTKSVWSWKIDRIIQANRGLIWEQ